MSIEELAKIVSKVLLFLLVLFPLYIQSTELNDLAPTKRIVGGEHILDSSTSNSSTSLDNIEQWPWVVALSSDGNQFCGASLINRYWLLTAAHCVYDTSTNAAYNNIQIQAIFLKSELSKQNSQSFSNNISEIIIHPEYNYNLDLNDIALLKLNQPVDDITPVHLPGTSYDAFTVSAGTISTVLGWGITQDRSDSELLLRKVEVPITEQSICAETMAKNSISIEDSMICAGYQEGGKDSCSGDSGGPLVYYSSSLQKWEQVGIVSFGVGCALPDEYGVYTRIAKYTQPEGFINNTICEQTPEVPNIQIIQNNRLVTINLSTQSQDNSFRLYYAPYPQMTPIKYIDILGNEFSVTLAENEIYFAAAQTLEINCISPFTDIHIVNQ